MMTKADARKYSEGYEGYQLAWIEDEYAFLQKERPGNKFSVIKVDFDSLKNGNYKRMFKLGMTLV